MKIVYIGNYPPRECGIGTFTQNKFIAMEYGNRARNEDPEGMVIAINDGENFYDYPKEVKFVIRQDELNDYIKAAGFINNSDADICIMEHEFGIFGGKNGVYILPLLQSLKMPFIAVLHTVLKSPSYIEKQVLAEIVKMAANTVVMTLKAVEFLTGIYGIHRKKITVIEHGVPDLEYNEEECRKELNLENKKVLLTFGLIGRNKGIETVIKALPPVAEKHPEILYIVLGKTHPSVLHHSGEEYRIYLTCLIKELHLEKRVLFINEFVDEKKLLKYLSAADVYVTPYLNEAQITSGTLAYAIGAGCAVVSTPYWHASEVLTEGRGCLFDFEDHGQLSSILLDLLNNPHVMNKLRSNARTYGSETTWPKIGERYIMLCKRILQQELWQTKKDAIPDPLILPSFSMEHIRRLTDDTGIMQHAKFGMPNFREGYCLDDNARALLMVLMAYKQEKYTHAEELLPVYLSYIHYMQKEDGMFRNFLSFNRNFIDTVGSEDSFGRTMWALGYLVANAPNDAYYQAGKHIFFCAAPNFKNLQSLRGIANTIVGICYYLENAPSDIEMKGSLRDLTYRLIREYNSCATDGWKWFEQSLTYDNAILPLSMLHAAHILQEQQVMETALESMHFLSGLTLKNGYLSVIGNENWYPKNGKRSVFGQQPIDVMAMVLMFQKAFLLTNERTCLNNLYTSFMWFLGENELRLSMYDQETKGCCDGLENYGVNRNQGAESTLAYLISYLAILQTFNNAVGAVGEDFLKGRKNILNGNTLTVG